MAFRKRNVAIRNPSLGAPGGNAIASPDQIPPDGVRPSPLTSQPTTSTGTPSLDGLLGGHAGLVLGSSLLIEESGTTDFSGALLRYYAAQGLCHGHVLHIVGVDENWVRELPGLADKQLEQEEKKATVHAMASKAADQRMKIAWRYERSAEGNKRGAVMPQS